MLFYFLLKVVKDVFKMIPIKKIWKFGMSLGQKISHFCDLFVIKADLGPLFRFVFVFEELKSDWDHFFHYSFQYYMENMDALCVKSILVVMKLE